MPTAIEEIISVEDFYALALAIEREAAARYWEFAHQLLLYRQNAVAQVFLELARMESEHLEDLERRAEGMKLPSPKPSEYCWQDPEQPEGALLPIAHCLMKPRQALEIALANERRARDFYEHMCGSGCDPAIRQLAAERASEEAQHIACIERALRNGMLRPSDRAVSARSLRQPRLPRAMRS